MKIAVLYGGISSERHVSLASGKAIIAALNQSQNEVFALDTAWGRNQPAQSSERELNPLTRAQYGSMIQELIEVIRSNNVDLVFNALHGGIGENGVIQALLDLNKIKFTGSGFLASAVAMNKVISKRIFESEGIPTPHYLYYEQNTDFRSAETFINEKEYPIVVKPNAEGSTVGLTIVREEGALKDAWDKASQYGDVLIESYIEGRELTVSILGDEALPVIEIIPESGLYDYEHKYTPGKTNYVCPAEISSEITNEAKRLALSAFRTLGCRAYARVDFRLSVDNQIYCLEVNTLPGMTATSLVPKAAKASGMDFNQLINRIVQLSLK
jgi:D-alanine-D-alanine ligase